MRHWSRLATRNWQVKRVRTVGAVLAIALGVGAVVWVSCCYESVRQTVMGWAGGYVGRSHVNIESPLGKYSQFALRRVREVADLEGPDGRRLVKHMVPLLIQRLRGKVLRKSDYVEGQRYDPWTSPEVDYHGIDLASEFYVRDRPVLAGRMLTPADEYACVLEAAFAEQEGVGLGDYLVMWNESGDTQHKLEIVGLVDRRRIARFQPPLALLRLPVLQRINNKYGFVTSVDVVLHDGSRQSAAAAALKIRRIIRRNNAQAHVRSAVARMRQVALAQQQQEVVLALLSCVAMLTALFIILSTLSMGMLERITQLGLLRCVGVTGRQLAALVFAEVVPLGLLGILLGIPLGLGLTGLTVWLVPEYVGKFTVSLRGMLLAAIAGFLTSLVAASLPAMAAAGVSPLDAWRPRARRARRTPLVVAVVLAGVLLAGQLVIVTYKVTRNLEFVHWSATAVVLLYLVYASAAPLLVWVVTSLGVWVVTRVGVLASALSPVLVGTVVLMIRARTLTDYVTATETATAAMILLAVTLALAFAWLLASPIVPRVNSLVRAYVRTLQDQVGHAVWRSAGICCGLMVGLSLIVALVVLNRSFRAGWQFPKQFAEAYIWSYDQFPMSADEAARRVSAVAGVKNFTLANALNVVVEERSPESTRTQIFHSATWFLGIDPDTFLDLVKFEFIEGDEQTARRLLKEGGHLLVAVDFARSRHKSVVPDEERGLSNTVRVWFGDHGWRKFRVAGVIDSPALDVAASFFQAESEARMAAVGSVIGTNADLKRLFQIDSAKLVLLNFDLPPEPPPAGWPPPRQASAGTLVPDARYDQRVPLETRWERAREADLLRDLRRELRAYGAYVGTARELKDHIDTELTRVTYLLTAVPAVALIVAAIGVANLMTANVTSRTKQLAIMRAVGATRGQILRMVMGEALVLGALGSALGLALGLHLARDVSTMTVQFSGFEAALEIPWGFVLAAIGLTVGLCVLAGVWPARHASRTNVIDALHVA